MHHIAEWVLMLPIQNMEEPQKYITSPRPGGHFSLANYSPNFSQKFDQKLASNPGGHFSRIFYMKTHIARPHPARLSHKNVLTPTYILPRFLGRLPAYLSWEESEIHEVLSDWS